MLKTISFPTLPIHPSRLTLVLSGCIAFLAPTILRAQVWNQWIGQDGYWKVSSNWTSDPLLPGPNHNVQIQSPTPVSVTHEQGADSIYGLYNDNQLAITGGALNISDNAYLSYWGGDAQVSLNAANLQAAKEYVGWIGKGTFLHESGTNQTTTLHVGVNVGGDGLYRLEAGTLDAVEISIGHAGGSGAFQQTQGENHVAQALYLGSATNAGSSGKYTVSGGILNAENGKIYLGQIGAGTFELNGGAVIVDEFVKNAATGAFTSSDTGILFVNKLTGWGNDFSINGGLAFGHVGGAAAGNYALGNGQSLAVNGELTVGHTAPGTLAQTGGTTAVADRIYLGRYPGATGSYLLSGSGTIAVKEVDVGYQGQGTFTQNGGMQQIAATLYLGRYLGATGAYFLSAGGLSANDISIGHTGGAGIFEQSGGINTVNHDLLLGAEWIPSSGGGYTITGGTLNVLNGKIRVGQVGQGVFDLNGGAVSAGEVGISSNGTLNWRDGTLTIPAGVPLVNDGIFNLFGGDRALGRIEGTGKTAVIGGSLTATGINQNSLLIGGAANAGFQSVSGASTSEGGNAITVPEPITLLLSGWGVFGMLIFAWRRR
ncbi:MAG: PEP-CTERM sorting domain-containing protein [Pirellulales bacterium]|nr:PEP-CTERM sorting domain-containing protein [Pirellulales bacterium]